MASSPAAATLTAAEQRAEQKLGLLYYAIALRMWTKYVTPEDVDGSGYLKLLELLIPEITKARGTAAKNGRTYYEAFRILETSDRDHKPAGELVTLDKQVIETSIRVTGPVAFKGRMTQIGQLDGISSTTEKALVNEAFKKSGQGVAAAMMRHVIDGSRQQVQADVRSDRVAVGWARVTKSVAPCYFCAMLASRSFVYDKESFAQSDSLFVGEGKVKVHDHCACIIEPRFSRDAPLPGRAEEFSEIWGNSTRGKSGRAAIQAFRRAYENS